MNNAKGITSKIYTYLIEIDTNILNGFKTIWENDIGIKIEQNVWNKLWMTQTRKTVLIPLREYSLKLLHQCFITPA